MRQTAEMDGAAVDIEVEQEPGSEGKSYCVYLRRHVFRGFHMHHEPSTGPKDLRIRMLQPIVNGGDVSVVLGPWTQAFLDELDPWPHVDHDDQLDGFAGAHRALSKPKGRLIV